MALSALISLMLVGVSVKVPVAQIHKADCTIFTLKDCPIANQYAPELKRLINSYRPKGIQFVMVIEDSDVTQQQLFTYAKSFGYNIPVGLDQGHSTAKQFGVAISPTVVLTKGDKILYRGRIDDTYPSIGKRRAATTHDLRDTLDAFLAGKPIKHPVTQAVGCRLF